MMQLATAVLTMEALFQMGFNDFLTRCENLDMDMDPKALAREVTSGAGYRVRVRIGHSHSSCF